MSDLFNDFSNECVCVCFFHFVHTERDEIKHRKKVICFGGRKIKARIIIESSQAILFFLRFYFDGGFSRKKNEVRQINGW